MDSEDRQAHLVSLSVGWTAQLCGREERPQVAVKDNLLTHTTQSKVLQKPDRETTSNGQEHANIVRCGFCGWCGPSEEPGCTDRSCSGSWEEEVFRLPLRLATGGS